MKEMVTRAVAVAAATIIVGIAATATVTASEPVGFAGCPVRGMGMMWDEDGTFLSREAFKERLDTLISDGLISLHDREFMLERFELCRANDGGIAGRCGTGGRGAGRGLMR
ncbi:MAG: hypothetical protein FWD98_00565 [Defluviitaleaceae bacterium]|nr:hypothetical protein [Defluviitaleaceae bacterium]